jgi:O-acetyl-ADP-ribose deacetylase
MLKQSFFLGTIFILYTLSVNTQTEQIKYIAHHTTITLCVEPRYDITCATTEAIVNPANSMLMHGGGIARAISDAAGPKLQKWSDEQPLHNNERIAVGNAIISSSFDLHQKSIKYIIHTVGPDFRDPIQQKNGAKLLYDAWYNALSMAHEQGIVSITFPSISTGIFRCPKHIAATQAYRAICDFIHDHPDTSIRHIVIGLWEDTGEAYRKIMQQDESSSKLHVC